MSARNLHDLAIVGAGMVGAALALALAREGFDVAVIEPRAPKPWSAQDEVDLRVVALAPSSVDLFTRLDVWKEIVTARASAYRRMRVWDALAPGALEFDATDEGRACTWLHRRESPHPIGAVERLATRIAHHAALSG
jgi:2-octaprenyl-3-methyl-6-methoxy-1,4-benzoquinol hydroxylase/2-octaprenylphenol hydroxylase